MPELQEENKSMPGKNPNVASLRSIILQLVILLGALYLTSFYGYLFFHVLAEIVSVVIATAIYLLAWNARKYLDNKYYLLIGFGFLTVGVIDLAHTLSFQGMGIINPADESNIATQLWLAGRFVIALTLLGAPFFSVRKLKDSTIFLYYLAILIFFILAIFYWRIFPAAYVNGVGLTWFKKISEYFIIAAFFIALLIFYRRRHDFDARSFRLLVAAIILLALSEFSFTLYVGVTDFFNLLGHLLKVASYYLAYLGIVEFGLMRPYDLLFKKLKEEEKRIRESEKRYRTLADFSPDAIVVHSGGVIDYVNEAAVKIFGCKNYQEMVGRGLVDFFRDDYKEIIRGRIEKINSGELDQVPIVEMVGIRSGGEEISVEIKSQKIEHADNISIESIIRDITERKKAEDVIRSVALLPSENPTPVFRISAEGKMLFANRVATKLLNNWDCESGYAPLFLRAAATEVLAAGASKEIESNVDGRDFSFTLVPLPKRNYVNIYGQDITERKRANAELQKAADEWDMTFNSISDLIFILDKNHTIIKANKSLLEFFGKTQEEIIGKKCYELVHKMHQPWSNCPLEVTRLSGKSHTEEVDDPSLGKVLLVTTSPIFDKKGELVGIAHIAKDITERKEIERAKDEFISLASHQLRTPLSGIALAAELLLRGVTGKVDPEQRSILQEIYNGTRRMSALINHMLNISRIEMRSLAINREPMKIQERIPSVLDDLQLQAQEKGISFASDLEESLPIIDLDENILRIIVENLVTNAIRYTASGGSIAVVLARQGSEVVLSVADTGCGIPKKEQGKIFRKSFRAENAKRINFDGTGLGLYMVKTVVEKIGARVWFVSEENKGTTFFVAFPLDS